MVLSLFPIKCVLKCISAYHVVKITFYSEVSYVMIRGSVKESEHFSHWGCGTTERAVGKIEKLESFKLGSRIWNWKDWRWKVRAEVEKFASKLESSSRNWKVITLSYKTGRSKMAYLRNRTVKKWKVWRVEIRQSKRLKVDGQKLGTKLIGLWDKSER